MWWTRMGVYACFELDDVEEIERGRLFISLCMLYEL